jgi:hypothetical protein
MMAMATPGFMEEEAAIGHQMFHLSLMDLF